MRYNDIKRAFQHFEKTSGNIFLPGSDCRQTSLVSRVSCSSVSLTITYLLTQHTYFNTIHHLCQTFTKLRLLHNVKCVCYCCYDEKGHRGHLTSSSQTASTVLQVFSEQRAFGAADFPDNRRAFSPTGHFSDCWGF